MVWLEIVIAALFLTLLIGAILSRGRSWLDPLFWRGFAISGSVVMLLFLFGLSWDTLRKTRIGSARVPAATVINRHIEYRFDPERGRYRPSIGGEELLFGRSWAPEEAQRLLIKGRLVIQSRNCMECHTLLGNGAYFAPDLTKAWLDPKWEQIMVPATGSESKEEAMVKFLRFPDRYATWRRRMPNLNLSEEEARAVVAYLKWMAAIDTNGFPDHFGRSGLLRRDR